MTELKKGAICPFGVYLKDDVTKTYTAALFTEPRHIRCDRDECALWDEDNCSVKKAMLSIAKLKVGDVR